MRETTSRSHTAFYVILSFPLLLVILFLIFKFQLIFSSFFFHFRFINDNIRYVLPKLYEIDYSFSMHQFFYWNPYESSGVYLFAVGCKPLFLSALLFFFSAAETIPIVTMIHIAIALSLFYCMSRMLGISQWGSAIAAVLWTFCGYHTYYANDIAVLGTNMWLPLLVISYMLLEQGRPYFLCLAICAFSIAMQAVGGRPTDIAYNMLMVSMFFTYRNVQIKRNNMSAIYSTAYFALFLFLAAVFGIAMASPLLFPFVEHIANSDRFISQANVIPTNYLSFTSLLGVLIPRGEIHWLRFHAGLVMLPLLFAAWSRRSSWLVRFCFWMLLISCLLLLPLGLFDLFRLIPLLGGANAAVRMLPMFIFGAALLAGIGFDAMIAAGIQGLPRPGRRALYAALLLGLVAVSWSSLSALRGQGQILRPVVTALEIIACTMLFLPLHKKSFHAAIVVLTVSTFTSLFLANHLLSDAHSIHLEDVFTNDRLPEAVQYINDHGGEDPFRVYTFPRTPFYETHLTRIGVQHTFVYEAARPARVETMRVLMLNGRRNPGVFDINNVRYLLGTKDVLPSWSADYQVAFESDDGSVVLENPDYLPRVFVARSWEVVSDPEQLLKRLALAGEELRDSVFLEQEPVDGPPPGQGAGQAEITRYTPNQVDVSVQMESPAYLVLLDSYSPSWVALIDGTPAAILRADYNFRAVAVPSGRHEVVFRYSARLEHAGLAVAGGAVLILAALILWGALRKRRVAA